MTRHDSHQRGFTIVELLIVIIVIGILAALVLVAYSNVNSQAKVATLQSDLENAGKALELTKTQNNDLYPTSQSAANLQASANNTFSYTYDSSNKYCLSETNAAGTYSITNSARAPKVGGCAGITNEVLAWWPMNGSMNDMSGNGVNSSVVSGMSSIAGANGAANGAYSFNGSASPTFPAIDLTNKSFTITGWMYVTSFNNGGSYYQSPLIGQSSIPGAYQALHAGVRSSSSTTNPKIYIDVYSNGSSGSTDVSTGVWNMYAYTIDGTSRARTMYLNASLEYNATPSVAYQGTINQLAGNCCMTSGLNGRLDDVRVYNRVLSASEIQSIYTAGAL